MVEIPDANYPCPGKPENKQPTAEETENRTKDDKYKFKGYGQYELLEWFGLDECLGLLEEKLTKHWSNSDFIENNYLEILEEYIFNRYSYHNDDNEILEPCYYYLKAVVESGSSYAEPVLKGLLELYEDKKYLEFYKCFMSNLPHMWY